MSYFEKGDLSKICSIQFKNFVTKNGMKVKKSKKNLFIKKLKNSSDNVVFFTDNIIDTS